VLVLSRVPLALLTAEAARQGAGLEHAANDLLVGARAPRGNCSGSVAYVCAVHVEPDALAELLDHVLGETGVSAGCASLSAAITLFDAADQSVVRAAAHVRVRPDHIMGMHRILVSLR
jgi:hypothetical protein